MALQMNYFHPLTETTVYNAYWRINPKNGLVGGKNEMTYVIEVFLNENVSHVQDAQAIERVVNSFIPDINVGAVNFIAQAYLHAKTLPYFSGSVDV
jgi:hypothetical protein